MLDAMMPIVDSIKTVEIIWAEEERAASSALVLCYGLANMLCTQRYSSVRFMGLAK